MKQKDDSTLSLFGDENQVSDLPDADGPRKKLPDIQTEQVTPVDPPLDIKIEPTVLVVMVTEAVSLQPLASEAITV